MAQFKRKKFLVDNSVQGALALRTVFYWLACTTVTIGIATLLKLASGRAGMETPYLDLANFCRPIAIASLLLLPVIAYDMVQMSNRFVGPIVRLRRSMIRLAQGEPVEPIIFRENDFWRDMAGEFNVIAAELQKLRRQTSRSQSLDRTQPISLNDAADASAEAEHALV